MTYQDKTKESFKEEDKVWTQRWIWYVKNAEAETCDVLLSFENNEKNNYVYHNVSKKEILSADVYKKEKLYEILTYFWLTEDELKDHTMWDLVRRYFDIKNLAQPVYGLATHPSNEYEQVSEEELWQYDIERFGDMLWTDIVDGEAYSEKISRLPIVQKKRFFNEMTKITREVFERFRNEDWSPSSHGQFEPEFIKARQKMDPKVHDELRRIFK